MSHCLAASEDVEDVQPLRVFGHFGNGQTTASGAGV
jgi:hypothetical protein